MCPQGGTASAGTSAATNALMSTMIFVDALMNAICVPQAQALAQAQAQAQIFANALMSTMIFVDALMNAICSHVDIIRASRKVFMGSFR